MKKMLAILMTVVILTIALVGCSAGKYESAEAPTQAPTTELTEPPTEESEVEMDSFVLDDIYMAPEEQETTQEKEEDARQFLLNSIYEDLGIGFEDYGILVNIDGTDAYVLHANSEWTIHTLCANNSYLEEHDVRFNVPKGSTIVRFVPPTLESCGYVKDDESTWGSIGECYGYVWESQLDSVTALRWESQLIIEIDGKYNIYVNYDEIPENTDSCLGIN